MDDVDLLFFCTKNPIPILDKLKYIKKKMYFHVTITPYKKNIEPNVISKNKIIEAVKKLSDIIGKENIVIRYDPLFISDEYSLEYHKKAFEKLCKELSGYINKILIHFIDDYKNVRKNYSILKYRLLEEKDYKQIAESFVASAKKYNIIVHTCNEENNLTKYGFKKDECLSKELAFKLTGKVYKNKWNIRKDLVCQCIKMVDIGVYNSCLHFCKYCYANYDENKVKENYMKHNPKSSLLIGELKETDIIINRIK